MIRIYYNFVLTDKNTKCYNKNPPTKTSRWKKQKSWKKSWQNEDDMLIYNSCASDNSKTKSNTWKAGGNAGNTGQNLDKQTVMQPWKFIEKKTEAKAEVRYRKVSKKRIIQWTKTNLNNSKGFYTEEMKCRRKG